MGFDRLIFCRRDRPQLVRSADESPHYELFLLFELMTVISIESTDMNICLRIACDTKSGLNIQFISLDDGCG